MRLKIYLYPGGPNVEAVRETINGLKPEVSSVVENHVITYASQIINSLDNHDSSGNGTHFAQTQTMSDNNHTIVLKGRSKQPGFWERLLG